MQHVAGMKHRIAIESLAFQYLWQDKIAFAEKVVARGPVQRSALMAASAPFLTSKSRRLDRGYGQWQLPYLL